MPDEEWIKKLEDGRNVKFIYQELPEDGAFITAQLFVAGFFEHSVSQIDTIGGKSLSGSEYAAGLRHRIAEHRELIKSVKTG